MAADYTSGSASSFSDLQTALENFLVASGGWTAAAGTGVNRIWTKGDLVVRSYYDADAFYCRGATGVAGTATTGDAPLAVKMGSPAGGLIAFPVDYEIFWNDTPEEVYAVIAYGGNKYQHINFGESDIPGIGGTGQWITGTYKGDADLSSAFYSPKVFMGGYKDDSGGGSVQVTAYAGASCGFFMHAASPAYGSSFIHTGLEGADAWRDTGNEAVGTLTYARAVGDLLMALPSQFNEAEVLLPIYSILRRTDDVWTITSAMRHARVLRIDNVTPGDIITYGGDQWKVYPWFAKNSAERNGVAWATGAPHSGTFGVAIRYPGV